MNRFLKAMCASALLAVAATSAPALAQDGHRRGDHEERWDRHQRGDYERHRGGWDRRRGDRLDNRRYTRRWDRRWDNRWRDRGDACRLMGYGRGCRSYSSDGAYIIFRLFEDLYCYRRAPYGAYQVVCPYNWYDY